MALFVQIDHFRKTDQKPTVKNHLFSISWFRSFNRTSFQQQLKPQDHMVQIEDLLLQSYILSTTTETLHSSSDCPLFRQLQSYILSTTTETLRPPQRFFPRYRFNRTSFQQQLKRIEVPEHSRPDELQSYILSTTTETHSKKRENSAPDQTQPNF